MNNNLDTTFCKICGQPMTNDYQPAQMAGREGDMLVTCWQPSCPMRKFTLVRSDYADVDFTMYMKPARSAKGSK